MMKPLSFEVLLTEIGEPKADFERVYPYKDIVFWSFIRKEHQKQIGGQRPQSQR